MAKTELQGIETPPAATSREFLGGKLRLSSRGDVALRSDRAAALQPIPKDVKDDDILEVELADGVRIWTSFAQWKQDVPSAEKRGGTDAEYVFPAALPSSAAERGLGGWLIQRIGFHRLEGEAAELSALGVAKLVEQQVAPHLGLRQLDLASAQGIEPGPTGPAPMEFEEGKPILVFIHGTASSSKGSFGALWAAEQKPVREALLAAYGRNVAAFDHRTMSESPIRNALQLAEQVPPGAELHLVSHSRGGLVGELLCRAGVDAPVKPFVDEDLRLLAGDERGEQRRDLERLGQVLRKQGLKVRRFVRVACPVRGTTLAAGRLDRFFSVILNLLRLGSAGGANPWVEGLEVLVGFTAAVARQRTDPRVLPGLEAMMPESPVVRMLNRPGVVVDSDLTVLAGDVEPTGVLQRLAVLLTDLYYLEQHDFVVNTRAMIGGARRERGARHFLDQGTDVSHFNYFRNADTTRRLLLGLTQSSGFEDSFTRTEVVDPMEVRGAVRAVRPVVTGPRPRVFVLPGIMGSSLAVPSGRGLDTVWLDYGELAWGGLPNKLSIEAPQVVAEAPLPSAYGELLEALAVTHVVRPFAYDWRKSLEDQAGRLADAMRRELAEAEREDQPMRIVAHSMGGLLTRALFAFHPDLWGRFRRHADSRILLLGTPARGSHTITRIFVGQESTLKMLALLDLKHSRQELQATIAAYPGVLELLPEDGGEDVFEPKTWARLAKADQGNVVVLGEKTLAAARRVRTRLAEFAWDPERVVYVAGLAPETPSGLVFNSDGGRERFEVLATDQGDGRVPWATGIPSELKRVYRLDVAHGDLAAHAPAFPAIVELLQRGETTLLEKFAAATSRGGARSWVMRDDPAPLVPDPEVFERVARGATVRRRTRRDAERITVSIRHGNLRYARFPVVVGHYQGDAIVSAERQLDGLLNQRLSAMHQLGLYPGPVGTAEPLFGEGPGVPGSEGTAEPLFKEGPSVRGAVVIGLGGVGELTSGELATSFARGLLRYAAQRANPSKSSDPSGSVDLGFCPLLVGTGSGGLPLRDALAAMLRGTLQAADSLRESRSGRKVRLTTLEFIEIYEDQAIEAGHVLWELGRTPEFVSRLTVQGAVESGEGGWRRASVAEAPGWWGRLMITGSEYGALEYVSLTSRARAEVQQQLLQRRLVDGFVEQAITGTGEDRRTGEALFELLFPNELKEQAPEQSDLVAVVNDESARYPWELLRDRRHQGDQPWVVGRGFLRQLRTSEYPAASEIPYARTDRAYVVGDPPVPGWPALEGARKEADLVTGLLQTASAGAFRVTTQVRSNAGEITKDLFAGEYRIIHLAGHGAHNVPVKRKDGTIGGERISGMVIGPDVFLSPLEIKQLRSVPELVFINCCHLGRIEADSEAVRYFAPHRLAANLATEFIRKGVRAVVAAGWAVDDAAALTFARTFYGHLLDGGSFGEAVRLARFEVWQAHPGCNTWGAYQCYGDPGYRLRGRGEGTGGGGGAVPRPFVSVVEAIAELENLTRRAGGGEWQLPVLREAVDRIKAAAERGGWLVDTRLRAALGTALGECGRLEEAIVQMREAVEAADGRAEFRVVEQLANFEARHAAAVAGKKPGTKWAPGFSPDELLESAEKRVKTLLEFHPTPERWSLLGSAFKRRVRVGRASVRRRSLAEMARAYREADALARAKDGRSSHYSLLNALAAEIALGWLTKSTGTRRAAVPEKFAEQLEAARTSAREEESRKPSFWNVAAEGDCSLLELVVDRQPESKVAKVVAAYRVAKQRGVSPREWMSVTDQVRFLRQMAEAGKRPALAEILKRLIAHLDAD